VVKALVSRQRELSFGARPSIVFVFVFSWYSGFSISSITTFPDSNSMRNGRQITIMKIFYKSLLFIICLSTSVGHLHSVLNHGNGTLFMDLVRAWQDLTTAERIL